MNFTSLARIPVIGKALAWCLQRRRRLGISLICLFFATFSGSITFAQAIGTSCGELYGPGQYGPYDFRTDKDKLPLVLGTHFTPIVEELIRGTTNATPGGDIDYTLRAIPNNPRALLSMMRLGEREKTPQPSGSHYTVECWFDRAIRFRPDDNVVRMLYVAFLTKNSRKSDAIQQLETVLRTAQDNPFTHYNAGLLYFDLNEYEKALTQAHKAMELGLLRPELREKLKAAGKWQEPAATGLAATPAEPSASDAPAPKP